MAVSYLPHPCPVCGDPIRTDAPRGHHPETYEWCHDECLEDLEVQEGLHGATLDDMQQEGHL